MRKHFSDGLVRLLIPLALAAAVGSAVGCRTAVPYRPDRAVARAIPSDRAKAELQRVLGTAFTYTRRFTVARVGDDGFTLREEQGQDHVYSYAALAPEAFTFTGADGFFVRLTPGGIGGFTPVGLESDAFIIAKSDDLEILLDALESLKADALARR